MDKDNMENIVPAKPEDVCVCIILLCLHKALQSCWHGYGPWVYLINLSSNLPKKKFYGDIFYIISNYGTYSMRGTISCLACREILYYNYVFASVYTVGCLLTVTYSKYSVKSQ